ncbi:GNAT family N-acetyltransferase [Alicyclobacillus mengziensis]|uniref:GNAT family N-acetyltransferase n=1 Tax=Alicyclobacillus mengziensis TaxID=2931921 RepID=A0A9X7VZ33_9BACL|nr:GNAT family N-acetyltransferase [Alicyclobacillus mengziensis]QSO47679.1 GNAT family N-acetyltransferase [Alicyclobacillus mengziensis]
MDEIRTLRQEDIDGSLKLSQFAFQYEIPESEWIEARQDTNPEQIYAVYVNNNLAAKLHLLPFSVYIGGVPFAMGGVAGVATWPEYRRGGRVAQLLHHALGVMKDAGQVVSLLAPFSFSFYRKYGWEHCIDRKQYTIHKVDWPKFSDAVGSVRRSDDLNELKPPYETFASRYSGMLQRTDEWWQRREKRWGTAIRAGYQTESGAAEGYIVYQVKQSTLTIHEFVYITEEARQGLWNFINNHDSMADKVTLIAPTNDVLPFLLPNPRITQEIVPYFMARIVDVEKFLRQFPFVRFPLAHDASNLSNTLLNIRVTDVHAPWNEGTFQVRLPVADSGDVTVERLSVDSSDSLLDVVSMDIQTLTAVMFGYQRPSLLQQLGRISGSRETIQALEQSLPPQTPFLYDFF